MKTDSFSFASTLPESVEHFERMAGVSLTIHDVQGIHPPRWRHRQMPNRHLHCAPFCMEGRFEHPVWNNRCTEDCLKEVHAQVRRNPAPFCKTCWKGVRELVVPIVREGRVILVLYAGPFREPGTAKPACDLRLSPQCIKHFRELPEWSETRAAELTSVMTVFGHGLLDRLGEMTEQESSGSREQIIKKFIIDNSHRALSLAELAEILHLSLSRTGHAVREELGMTFHEAVMCERMNRAANLLTAHYKLPLAEIAAIVGFRDTHYFIRCFTRHFGVPPRAYQKKNRE
ncbi:MAG: helix-turn-helix domain-containing protein [Lentisphaeria bacterium]|nr:helix-turn-helix domain-containing protein [Lentisphaeria bacterium]